MKFNKIIVSNYIFKDELGDFIFHDVTLMVEINSVVTSEKFNQRTDDYSISSTEIDRMNRDAAQIFFNNKYKKILKNEYVISSKELNGIRLFLGVNWSELAKLLNLNKSTISRVINEKHPIQRDTMLLIMEKMKNEIETPEITRSLLNSIEDDKVYEIKELDLSPKIISEWIIRRFSELEECLTHLKLQKLLYYAQGIAISRYHAWLFLEDIYAWDHGPVIKSVYHEYKDNGKGALTHNLVLDISVIEKNEEVIKIINDTINTYGKSSAWVLRNKTHCETPWLETIRYNKIERQKIEQFFTSL